MAGNIDMEIFVKRGIGYETVEMREDKTTEIGYLEIDSIFSPVLNIGLDIENVRVGKMTNWDKLVINILTDGTVSPFDAFKKANQILIEQFSSLTEENKEKEDKENETVDEEVEDKKKKKTKKSE